MIDDKPGILAAMKQSWGAKLTTVFPQQGHYARMSQATDSKPDMTIEHIADLIARRYSDFAPPN